MELDEKIELFMGMLRCKYSVDLMVFDNTMTPLTDLVDDRSRMLYKILETNGQLKKIQEQAEKGEDLVCIGGRVGMIWGSVCLRQNGLPHHYYVLGPVLGTELELADMEKELHDNLNRRLDIDPEGTSSSVSFQIRFTNLMKSFPVMTANKFNDDLIMFGYCVTGIQRTRSDIDLALQPMGDFDDLRSSRRKKRNDRNRTWMTEQALTQMVRDGNLNYRQVLADAGRVSDGVPVKVRGSLLQAQISDITLITICVRAAIDGGLTPDAAYSLGDSYIQQVMDSTTLPELAQLNHTMFDDFVHRVHKIRCSPEVSPKVQQCMDYLELHVDEEVDIAQLAKMTGYTEYYLSRKFKEEAHVSLNDYSKIVRIERAKILLCTTSNSINQIADQLHFCSGSYFAKVFQKYVGIGPAEYRVKNKK